MDPSDQRVFVFLW